MIDVKPFVNTLNNKPLAVFGLGISNIAAIKALKKAGATIVAWDDNEDRLQIAKDEGAILKNLLDEDLSQYACLILAPGIPFTHNPHPVVKRAQTANIEIICDIEILHRCKHGRITIGVTGTNGKSTTTALIGHVLRECGIKTAIGGNIGKPALELTMPPKDGALVLELSSFQLDLCPQFAPQISVLLNLSSDHLDRHGDMDHYVASKKRIFRGKGSAIIGQDDPWSKKMTTQIQEENTRHVHPISVTQPVENGVYVSENILYETLFGNTEERFTMDIPRLSGIHNNQNTASVYSVARLLNLEPQNIYEALKTFPGLNHRQYLIRTINGIGYINDSKATNASAAARALASYKNIYWIVGGRAKEGGLHGTEDFMKNVKHAFLIGEAADSFASWLDNHGVSHSFCQTMDKAVDEAHRMAQADRGRPGGMGTVVLSPACASFDQFKNFEERGEAFTTLVNNLQDNPA